MKHWVAVYPKDSTGWRDVIELVKDIPIGEICTCYGDNTENTAREIACLPELYEIVKKIAKGKHVSQESAQKIINKYKGVPK
jgi:hypothetical protein